MQYPRRIAAFSNARMNMCLEDKQVSERQEADGAAICRPRAS